METSATTYAPTSQIAVISASLPVLTTLISFFINHEKPTRKQVFFMCLSVAGVMSINLISGQMVGGTSLGLILIACGTVAVSTQRSVMRRATLSFTAFECVYIPTAIGAVGFTLISVISHISRESFTTYFDGLLVPEFVIPILYMGICSSVIAFLCLTYAGANLPVAVSGSTGTLNTAITILVGVFILGETLRPIDIVGIVVILCGIIGISLSYDKNSKDGNRLKLQPMPKRR
jgi:drug/metabolite transporter (DMT)-like permease